MKLVGVAVCVFSLFLIATGIGSSLHFLTIGGITQFVEGCKATPTSAADIAIGALRFLLTGFGIWLSIILGAVLFALGVEVHDKK